MSAQRAARVAAIVGLCLHASTFAMAPARAVVAPDAACFASATSAALAALREATPMSHKLEHGGAILRTGSCYQFTTPVTSGSAHRVDFAIAKKAGAELAAIYHTHPAHNDKSERFSDGDVATAAALSVPSYIGVVADGSVRVLPPNFKAERGNTRGINRTPGAAGELIASL